MNNRSRRNISTSNSTSMCWALFSPPRKQRNISIPLEDASSTSVPALGPIRFPAPRFTALQRPLLTQSRNPCPRSWAGGRSESILSIPGWWRRKAFTRRECWAQTSISRFWRKLPSGALVSQRTSERLPHSLPQTMRVGFRARPCSLLAATAKRKNLYGNIKVVEVYERPGSTN